MKESAWALTNLSNPFRHRAAFARPAPPESESEHACVHVGWQLQQISHGEGRLRVTRRRNERQQALGVKLLAALEGCHLPSGCLGDLLPAWQPKMWTTVSNNYQQRASEPGCWVCLSYCMFSLCCSFGYLCNHTQHQGRGCLSHTQRRLLRFGSPSVIYESLILLYNSERYEARLRFITGCLARQQQPCLRVCSEVSQQLNYGFYFVVFFLLYVVVPDRETFQC